MSKNAVNENDPPAVSQAEGYLLALSHLRSHYNRQNDGRGYVNEEDQAAAASVLKWIESFRKAVTGERLGEHWDDPELDFGDSMIWTSVDLSHFNTANAFARYHRGAYVWELIWSHYSSGGLKLFASDPKQLRAQLMWAIVALDGAVARWEKEQGTSGEKEGQDGE